MRIGRRPHIHANFLQGLPIAILSIFNGLEQEVKRYVIFPSPARTLCPGALRSRRLRVRSVDAAIDRLRRAAARPPALLPRRKLAEQRRLVEGAWIAIAVEPVDELDEQRDGLHVALRDAARSQTQRRLEPGELHRLVIGRALSARRRRAHDLPQPFARNALLRRDVPVARPFLQAGEDALDAERPGRRGE